MDAARHHRFVTATAGGIAAPSGAAHSANRLYGPHVEGGSAIATSALIIDSDSQHTRALSQLLESVGFEVIVAEDGAILRAPALAFVCIDQLGFHKEMLNDGLLGEAIEIVLMAEADNAPLVRQCMSIGATYFFRKPFEPAFLKPLARDVFAEAGVTSDTAPESQDIPALDQFGHMRGSSPTMRKLYRVIRKLGPSRTNVLLTGESGTGKELAARTLHDLSKCSDGPFIALNCAAVPKELFESELFGHEKGSFSGADRRHHGFFERAQNGTLFLDELGEMPMMLQAKLLRVLEVGRYRRVGGEQDIDTNARIIAATNRVPEDAIAKGTLREDLYYRIARFPVQLPPLRSRGDDIVGLAHFFLDELNRVNGSSVAISGAALDELARYSWPGNVRELVSAIEHAYVLAQREIELQHLPDLDASVSDGRLRISVGETVEDAERKLIFATLQAHDGNKPAAADVLGLSLRTLYNRLNQYEAD